MTKKTLDNKKKISKKLKKNKVLITDTSINESTDENASLNEGKLKQIKKVVKKKARNTVEKDTKVSIMDSIFSGVRSTNRSSKIQKQSRNETRNKKINTGKKAENSIKESTNKSKKTLKHKKKKILNRSIFIRRLKRTLSNAARLTINSKKRIKTNLNTQKLLTRKKKKITNKKGCKSGKHKRVKDVLTRSHLVLLRNVNKTAYLNKVVKFEYLIRSLKQFMLVLNLFLNYKCCHTVYLMVNTVSQKSFVTAIIAKLRLKNLVFVSNSLKELYNCKGSKVVLILDGLLIQNQCSVVNAMVRSRNYLVFQMDNFPRHEYCGTYHFIADDSNVKSIIFFLLLIKRIIYKKFKICD